MTPMQFAVQKFSKDSGMGQLLHAFRLVVARRKIKIFPFVDFEKI